MGGGIGRPRATTASLAPADLVLKAACERCGAASELYLTSCRHTTLCSDCGKTLARARGRCTVCNAPVTRLIRVRPPRRLYNADFRWQSGEQCGPSSSGYRLFPPGISRYSHGSLRRSSMSGWIPPRRRRRPTPSAGSPPACRPSPKRGAQKTGGLFARMFPKDGSLLGICGYWLLIVDDHHCHSFALDNLTILSLNWYP